MSLLKKVLPFVFLTCCWILSSEAAGMRNGIRTSQQQLQQQLNRQQAQIEADGSKKPGNLAVKCSEGQKRFADPNNEGKFYMCSYSSSHRIWMVYSFTCPAETVFDNRSQSCGKKYVAKQPYPQHGTRFKTRPKPGLGYSLSSSTVRPVAAVRNPTRGSPRPSASRPKLPLNRPNTFRVPPLPVMTTTTTTTPTTTTPTTTTTTTTTEKPTTTTTTTTVPPTTTRPTTAAPAEDSSELDTKSTEVGPTKHIGVIRKVASNIAYLAEVMEGLLTSLESFMSECDEFVKEDYLEEILPTIFSSSSSSSSSSPTTKLKTSKLSPFPSASSSSSAEIEDRETSASEEDAAATALETLSSNEVSELKEEESDSDIQSALVTRPEDASVQRPSEWNIFLSTVKTSVPTTTTMTAATNPVDNPSMTTAVKHPTNMAPTNSKESNDSAPSPPPLPSRQQISSTPTTSDSILPALLTKTANNGGNRRPRPLPFAITSSEPF